MHFSKTLLDFEGSFICIQKASLDSEVKTIPCQFHVSAFTKEAGRASQAPYHKEYNVCRD